MSDAPKVRVRDHAFIKQEEREAAREANRWLKSYLDSQDATRGLVAHFELRLYPKRPPGFSAYLMKVLTILASDPAARALSNREIVKRIQAKFPRYKVPAGILDRRLTQYDLPRVRRILADHDVTLDLAVHDSLSKIKRALSAKAISATARSSAQIRIAFDDNAVVVEDRVYKITTTKTGYRRIMVGGQKLRVDVLKALVGRDG